MAVQIEDSGDYLYTLTEPVTEPPLTISCWCKTSGATFDTGTIVTIETPDTVGYNVLGAVQNAGTVANDPVRALTYNGADYGIAVTSTSVTSNVWNHYCCTFTSIASRAAFLNGGGKGTNTDSRAATPSELMIHGQRRNNRLSQFSTYTPAVLIAEVAVWNIALSDAQIAQLAAGVIPTNIESDNLIAYWPLFDDSLDDKGSNNLTEVDAGAGSLTFDTEDHPSIEATIYSELSGTIAAQSVVSGNMDTTSVYTLSGTITAISTLSGNLGSTLVGLDPTATIYTKRLIVAGNNQIQYEDV